MPCMMCFMFFLSTPRQVLQMRTGQLSSVAIAVDCFLIATRCKQSWNKWNWRQSNEWSVSGWIACDNGNVRSSTPSRWAHDPGSGAFRARCLGFPADNICDKTLEQLEEWVLHTADALNTGLASTSWHVWRGLVTTDGPYSADARGNGAE
jgi:hypothetical protein